MAVGVVLVTAAACWAWLVWAFVQKVDGPIPLDRARRELADRLQRVVNVTLDPEARLVAAHESSGGLRGGGDSWFLAELDPPALERFEAGFHQTYRAADGTGRMVPFDGRMGSTRALEGLGGGFTPPAGSRAFWLCLPRNTCAVFLDNKFYFYLDDF